MLPLSIAQETMKWTRPAGAIVHRQVLAQQLVKSPRGACALDLLQAHASRLAMRIHVGDDAVKPMLDQVGT